MAQIATESGLMPAPVTRRRALIGPGERVELVLDFTSVAGKRVVLQSAKHKGGGGIASKTHVGPLMEFRVGARAEDPSAVPASLRPLPDWVAQASPNPQRKWEFSISKGLVPLLARQRQDVRPGALGRLPEARHDRDLGASQPHRGRPPDPHASHRLVHALAQRQAAPDP